MLVATSLAYVPADESHLVTAVCIRLYSPITCVITHGQMHHVQTCVRTYTYGHDHVNYVCTSHVVPCTVANQMEPRTRTMYVHMRKHTECTLCICWLCACVVIGVTCVHVTRNRSYTQEYVCMYCCTYMSCFVTLTALCREPPWYELA